MQRFESSIPYKNIYNMTTPDKWIVLEIPNTGYKVFGSWAGGYLNGDSWRLNSGIKSITKKDNDYIIEGFSGSYYKCNESAYGVMTSYSEGVLQNLLDKASDNGVNIKRLTFEEFKQLNIC
jgi:hypothetical protein